jgi:hypothetical protein
VLVVKEVQEALQRERRRLNFLARVKFLAGRAATSYYFTWVEHGLCSVRLCGSWQFPEDHSSRSGVEALHLVSRREVGE